MKVWRVNARTHDFKMEKVPPAWEFLGGRGLVARILLDEVPPMCEPLGPNNKLIFTPGLLVGHMLSSCDRVSVGGKSPLTGGVKESNAGGSTGYALTMLGIRALIIEDRPKTQDWYLLVLSASGVRFLPADDYIGMGVYEAAPKLLARFGEKVSLALIGPGGEMQLRAAGIQNLDKDKTPSRIAARGGLGALMGSKRIKAIIIDPSGGRKPPIADIEGFRKAQKVFTTALMKHPQIHTYKDYGTAAMVNMCQHFGSLPTRGFSEGRFEGAEKISGEFMRDLLLRRNKVSKPSHPCMRGCTIQCSNIYGDDSGNVIVAPLEYETIGLMGSNLGIDDLDQIARLSWVVNDLGLDSIDIGAALGVAAQAGLMNWGDGKRAMALLEEILAGTPLGRTLGNGAAMAGRVLGVERVPVVKGQAMSSYEPRVIKGTGVTFATTPQGADHTCGLTIRAKINHTDPKGQAKISRAGQISTAGYDTLGACLFAGFGFGTVLHTIPDLLNARYGWNLEKDILQELGKQTLTMEREFNRQAGFTKADDRLPEWMTFEPVPPVGTVFDVPDEELDAIFDFDKAL